MMGVDRSKAPRKVDPEEIKLKMHRWAVMHNARLGAMEGH